MSLQVTYHSDNRAIADTWFYVPKTNRKILAEVAFIGSTYNRSRSLNGVIPPSYAKNRLIELVDSEGR